MSEAVAQPEIQPEITATSIMAAAPGSGWEKIRTAGLRALRTLLQGIAGAFPAAGVGTAILSAGYWTTFGYSCLAALIAALVSFLHNVAGILPGDPGKDG